MPRRLPRPLPRPTHTTQLTAYTDFRTLPRLRRPCWPQHAIAQVLGCPWQRCTVHFLREALGYCPPRAATSAGCAVATDLQHRLRRARHANSSATRSSGSTNRCRRSRRCSRRPKKTCSPSTLPGRPLDEAALDQPARALQPRDRPPHRRRRHLPQRPRADPARRQRRHRTERRMARRSPLPQHPLARDVLDQERTKTTTERRHPSSPRPEQPTILPTSYTTSWDSTVVSRPNYWSGAISSE